MIARANLNISMVCIKTPTTTTTSSTSTSGVFTFTFPAGMLITDTYSLMTYGTAIASSTAWQTAFQSAWGTSTTAFYAQFPGYRTGLGAGADSCGS